MNLVYRTLESLKILRNADDIAVKLFNFFSVCLAMFVHFDPVCFLLDCPSQ
jgi:hypothetical protein